MNLSIFTKLFMLLLFVTNLTTLSAQEKTIVKETFKVYGNCEMCKTTMEKPLKSMKGVKSSKWNVASHKMTVKYDSSITSLDAIKKAIAAVGYDTEEHRASDEVYKKLHGCCQYERPAKK